MAPWLAASGLAVQGVCVTINRWAARADSNRSAIVEAFKAEGWVVHDLRRPLDLLCGKGGVTLLVECKTKTGKHTPAQSAFLQSWTGGPVATVRDADGARTVARAYG